MDNSRPDDRVLHNITELVDEERALYGKGELEERDVARLEEIKIKLDQCWDLLRQRDALREFGKDPSSAKLRPASVVEKYEQ